MTVVAFDIPDGSRESYEWNPGTRKFEEAVPSSPEKQISFTRAEFLRDIIGVAALAQALELQKTDTFIEAFRMLLYEQETVRTDDPTTIAGVAYLKSKGITIANPGAFV